MREFNRHTSILGGKTTADMSKDLDPNGGIGLRSELGVGLNVYLCTLDVWFKLPVYRPRDIDLGTASSSSKFSSKWLVKTPISTLWELNQGPRR